MFNSAPSAISEVLLMDAANMKQIRDIFPACMAAALVLLCSLDQRGRHCSSRVGALTEQRQRAQKIQESRCGRDDSESVSQPASQPVNQSASQ